MKTFATDYIAAGRVAQAHGKDGWVRVTIYSGLPDRFERVKVVFFETERGMEGKILAAIKKQHDSVLLKFKDVDTREAAKELVGKEIFVLEEEKVELPEDTYFIHDLIGLQVFDIHGNPVGTVSEVLTGTGNDVYVVKSAEREVLIPAVGEFVRQIDLKKRKMIVRLWEGM